MHFYLGSWYYDFSRYKETTMSFTQCLTPKEWRTKLLDLLGDYIGTYTYNSGGNEVYRPAISIGNPKNERVVCGIELIIPLAPTVADQYIAGKSVYTKQIWNIRFIQREPDSKGMILPLVIQRLGTYFHEAYGAYQQQTNVDDSYEQYLWQVTTYEVRDAISLNEINSVSDWVADV